MLPATAAFSDSTAPVMGMRTAMPAAATASGERPAPSLPITRASPPPAGGTASASGREFCSAAAYTAQPFSPSARRKAGNCGTTATGTLPAAPIEARSAFWENASAQPGERATASKPKAAALRSSAPRLEGSCTRSRHK